MKSGFDPLKPCRDWKDIALAYKGQLFYQTARMAYGIKYGIYLTALLYFLVRKKLNSSSRTPNWLKALVPVKEENRPAPPKRGLTWKVKPLPNLLLDTVEQSGNLIYFVVNRALRPVFAVASSWKVALYLSFALGAGVSIPFVGAISTGYLLGFGSFICLLSGYFEYQKAKQEEHLEIDNKLNKETLFLLQEQVKSLHKLINTPENHLGSPLPGSPVYRATRSTP